MKINIELDLTTDEMEELLVPGCKRTEFKAKMYDAMMRVVEGVIVKQMEKRDER